MAGGAVPNLRDPDDVFIGGILGDDVTEAAGHFRGALFEEANHLLALPRNDGHFHNESVHFARSLQIRRNTRGHQA